jgi:hypothetical protein
MPRFLISTPGTGVPPVLNNHRRDGHATFPDFYPWHGRPARDK